MNSGCFDERIPDFERTVKVFKQVLTEVKNLNEIQFVDAVEGVTWEHKLTDEEMWETTHKLDFSLLSFSEEVCVANTAQPTCTQRTTDVIDEEHKRLEEDELKRKEAESQKLLSSKPRKRTMIQRFLLPPIARKLRNKTKQMPNCV